MPSPERIMLALDAYPALLRAARYHLGQANVWQEEPGDVVHSVYLHALGRLETLDADSAVVPFLRRCIANRVRDVARYEARWGLAPLPARWLGLGTEHEEHEPDVPPALIAHDDPATLVEQAEAVALVRAVLAGLPAAQRALLLDEAPLRADRNRRATARRHFRREWEQAA